MYSESANDTYKVLYEYYKPKYIELHLSSNKKDKYIEHTNINCTQSILSNK